MKKLLTFFYCYSKLFLSFIFISVSADYAYSQVVGDVAWSYSLPYDSPSIQTYGQYEVDNMHYYIVNEENKEVALVANHKVRECAFTPIADTDFPTCYDWEKGTLSGDVTIPETIELNEEKYSVVMIGYGAFYGCENLKSVTLPSSIRFVSNNVFSGCTSLEQIKFENEFYIGPDAFTDCPAIKELDLHECTAYGYTLYRCPRLEVLKLPILKEVERMCLSPKVHLYDSANLKQIWCYATTPPECDIMVSGSDQEVKEKLGRITLCVPDNNVNAYRSATFWRLFNVVGFQYSGINQVTPSTAKSTYYDLNGRVCASPSKGIYIERTGNKSRKILIR